MASRLSGPAGADRGGTGNGAAAVGVASPQKVHTKKRRDAKSGASGVRQADLDNGVGRFSDDGTEYVMSIDGGRRPPLAWVNVVANPQFGFLVSESGAAHTWSRNSHEQRLTPWSNDPIRDPHGEAIYIRDEVSGEFWSPQPGPAPADGVYEVRHGFGYSTWRLCSHGLTQEVVAFVPPHDPLRVVRVRLTNDGRAARRVSLYSYQRLVVGTVAGDSGRFVVTERDDAGRLLLAHNRVNGDFSDGSVFAAAVGANGGARTAWTCDRASFIGRNGSPAAPRALTEPTLNGATGAGLDACFALKATLEIPAGRTVESAFLFGEASNDKAAADLVQRYRQAAEIDAALSATHDFWRATLTSVQIETPVTSTRS
jgi:cyclic beta-1,2-glucan synthetase